MSDHEMDAWMVICRENNNDPLASHVGCENAGGSAAFMFFLQEGALTSIAISPSGEATSLAETEIMDEVIEIARGVGLWGSVEAQFERFQPSKIAINTGRTPIADGLSHTQYTSMINGVDPVWTNRMVSAEPMIRSWLSVKIPAEVEIMRQAAEITARWEVEAYAAAIPGETTDRDIADFLEAKMAEMGVGDGWAAEQNPAVNSGKDRGHSHPTERVIQPGDFIQTDFGIRVHDRWVTDIQRFAYVLAPGETEPPADDLAKWEAARAGSRAAFAAMKPGATGNEVDRAQRVILKENGSIPVMWGTGHPVGYWAHDSGPGLSGGRLGQELRVSPTQILKPGMTFAFDGFHSWQLTDSTTKTLSVEEMAVITETGAEWLTPPQEDLILISSN
ncbi:MAG: aminopeptidase P family protein [Bacteroidetes Order II. Incertae sedis bacterium]|nr:aminopeptidase P family protein [Bacteroidetes Order II. bacterium]MBT4053227.1 aminopeptidase P family protein [Bacteroidetes Order II. bacterium]MBT4602989.1 aminopeptidase P family protein [Bacteroidetes Order II. bacterium]MBT5248586.1 aminopeptidase P family protein [Bacteroidetes Order II. bacterium]MBT6200365.1 aminopeptidase P family protein [Bacteroidetes Order II. bacterium]